MYIGLNLSDRPYFLKAQDSEDFVFSDFLLARPRNDPIVMAAYPVSAIKIESNSVVLASINLDCMSMLMSNFADRRGISAALIESAGVVLAAPADQAGMIGKPLDIVPLLSAITDKALNSDQDDGSRSFTAADGIASRAFLCADRGRQRPPDHDRLDRHAVGAGQPARLPEPA